MAVGVISQIIAFGSGDTLEPELVRSVDVIKAVAIAAITATVVASLVYAGASFEVSVILPGLLGISLINAVFAESMFGEIIEIGGALKDPRINKSHFERSLQVEEELVDPPGNVDISDLLEVASNLENIPDFERELLRSKLSDLISNVKRRRQFCAVPSNAEARRKYFDTLDRFLKWVTVRLDPEVLGEDLVKSVLKNLAGASSHCASRYMTECREAYERVIGSAQATTFEEMVLERLHQFRSTLALGIVGEYHPNVSSIMQAHMANDYFKALGNPRGIRGADACDFDDSYSFRIPQKVAVCRFDRHYTSSRILEEMMHWFNGDPDNSDDTPEHLRGNRINREFDPEMFISWFRDNRPEEYSEVGYGETGSAQNFEYLCKFVYEVDVESMMMGEIPHPTVSENAIAFMAQQFRVLN